VIPADLDKRVSLAGRLVPYLSGWLEFQFGHRTITHSLLAQIVIGAGLWWLLPGGVWLAVMSGWVSHSFMDMMTPGGVCWFWPARARCVLPGNADFRVGSMGLGELAVAGLLAAACFPLHSWAIAGQGATGLIRQAMGDIKGARETFDAAGAGFRWQVEIEGRDSRTAKAVSGTFEVIAAWKEGGFLVKTDSGMKTACGEVSCDLSVTKAVLRKGDPEQITAFTLRKATIPALDLMAAVARYEGVGAVFFVGRWNALDSGKTTPETLYYALPSDIPESGALLDVDITVQIRHPPGAQIPDWELSSDNEPMNNGINARDLLDKWL
jgi:inner membrane protein